mmetsp:Transcript_30379/g.66371  ORF Transcript_30379/g.66371 Transcript_30379/m.66371 type:complete len:229 (-) Transcript_30379:287-973(-)
MACIGSVFPQITAVRRKKSASFILGKVSHSPRRVGRSSLSVVAESSRPRAFMDISCDEEAAGRLVFELYPEYAPQTVENFATLMSGERRSIDPSLSYKGCSFEPYKGKYAYTCKGRGKNIYGKKKFVETTAMSTSRNETPGSGGGVYYGLPVDLDDDPNAIVVAVPISGPGFGTSRFVICRVGGSPGSVKERLLANLLVLGNLVEGVSTLQQMSSRDVEVKIEDCGLL